MESKKKDKGDNNDKYERNTRKSDALDNRVKFRPRDSILYDKFIGVRLKEERKLLKISQSELGKRVGGITFQQVQKYEKGVNRIPSSRLYEFSKIFNIPIGYFFEGIEKIESEKRLKHATKEDRERLQQEQQDLKMITKYLSKIRSKSLRKKAVNLIRVLSELE